MVVTPAGRDPPLASRALQPPRAPRQCPASAERRWCRDARARDRCGRTPCAIVPAMDFGVFMAPYHPVGESPLMTFRRDLELIEWCDRLGFDEAWVGEHHSAAWENIADPAVFLAAAGQRTHRIRLGSGVVSLPYHQPMMVADRFVQLDYLTNGRAMLGVGPGALISDAVMMGIDPVTQRPRMDEALGVIVRLLAGEVVTHAADWFELHEVRLQMLPVN